MYTTCEVPQLFVWEAEQMKENQNGCYLKTTCQNNQKSNQHVVSAYVTYSYQL